MDLHFKQGTERSFRMKIKHGQKNKIRIREIFVLPVILCFNRHKSYTTVARRGNVHFLVKISFLTSVPNSHAK